jgi:hypothetical protein
MISHDTNDTLSDIYRQHLDYPLWVISGQTQTAPANGHLSYVPKWMSCHPF